MLSPPKRGNKVANNLRNDPLYRQLNDPTGQKHDTGPDGMTTRLGPVACPIGVIIGDRRHSFSVPG